MLLLENLESKRHWVLSELDDNGNYLRCLLEQNLTPSSITNKYNVVADLLEDMCRRIKPFSGWFSKLIESYVNSDCNSEIILNNINQLLKFATIYIDSLNINFSSFTNMEKISRTSIIFTEDDIRAIAITSTALKLYSIFYYDGNLKLPANIHKEVYQILVSPCIENKTTTKMFQLIRARIYRSSITDRYMWDMIKMAISETPQSYVMTIFNSLMANMVCILSVDKNPIPFLVSITDDSVRWLMRTVYKDRILYGEAFSSSDDIYGSSLSRDSYYVYCCNDVIGKAAAVGMSLLETEYLLDQNQFDKVRDRLDIIDILTPPMKLLILPIASKVFEIPYKYLLTCIPKHALLIGIFLYHLSKDIIGEDFPVITEFLISCPKDVKYLSTRSSYKIRNTEFIINDPTPVFGFKSKTLKFNIMSSICGVINASKKNLVSVITGLPLRKISYLNLEYDIIKFFTKLYANQLDNVFEQIREKSEAYF